MAGLLLFHLVQPYGGIILVPNAICFHACLHANLRDNASIHHSFIQLKVKQAPLLPPLTSIQTGLVN
jgi:hypothetical protein